MEVVSKEDFYFILFLLYIFLEVKARYTGRKIDIGAVDFAECAFCSFFPMSFL